MRLNYLKAASKMTDKERSTLHQLKGQLLGFQTIFRVYTEVATDSKPEADTDYMRGYLSGQLAIAPKAVLLLGEAIVNIDNILKGATNV